CSLFPPLFPFLCPLLLLCCPPSVMKTSGNMVLWPSLFADLYARRGSSDIFSSRAPLPVCVCVPKRCLSRCIVGHSWHLRDPHPPCDHSLSLSLLLPLWRVLCRLCVCVCLSTHMRPRASSHVHVYVHKP